MKQRIAVLLMLGLMPWSELRAQAQQADTSFKVSARVEAGCAMSASYALHGTTLLRATCTPNSGYQIGLNEGTSPGATVNQRKMVSGANALNYQLYSDSSRSTIWGNTTGTDTVTGVGTGLAQDHTVFGAIPAAQVVPAGDYADTITVRIYY